MVVHTEVIESNSWPTRIGPVKGFRIYWVISAKRAMKVTFSILTSFHRYIKLSKLYYWMLEPSAWFLRGLAVTEEVHVQVRRCSCSVGRDTAARFLEKSLKYEVPVSRSGVSIIRKILDQEGNLDVLDTVQRYRKWKVILLSILLVCTYICSRYGFQGRIFYQSR